MSDYTGLIAAEELERHLGESAWRIVDCRFDLMQPSKGSDEYRQAHIPGAQYASLDEDLAGPVTELSGRHPLPSVGAFTEALATWGISNDSQVVVYDQGGGAVASRLWWMLRWLGHDKVALLDGGISLWRSAGLPISDDIVEFARGQFRPAADSNRIVSTDEIGAVLASGGAARIVDARDAERFAGRREPIDAVAGHIPGAVNLPFSDSLNNDGSWKSPDQLRRRWSRTLGAERDRPWISMCGSGVTACHLVLSAHLAGYAEPRLYVGSWSEWIRDPRRPVAAGTA